MTTPRTRLAEGRTDFERDLLRSWEKEQPSDRARRRALGIVGVGTVVGASSLASTAAATGSSSITGVATGVGTGAATASLAPKAAVLGILAIGKWIATGVVVAAAAGVAVHYVRPPSPASSPTYSTETSSLAASPSVRSITSPVPLSQPSSTASEFALLPVPPPVAAVDPVATTAPTPPFAPHLAAPVARSTASPPELGLMPGLADPSTAPKALDEHSKVGHPLGLGEQVAALDHAREALAAGNAEGALGLLDDYDMLFPMGLLAQEAVALRIEALMKRGNRGAATDLADRFLASNPTSPHAARIRLLLQGASNP